MVKYLCQIADVSTSGYYKFLKSTEFRKHREANDLKAKEIILKAFNHRGYKKGSRSIKMTLENEFGIKMNRKKIQRIMRKYDIVCPIRKVNPYKRITKATKEHRVVENKLNREFKQNIPGKILLTDITYMPYGNNKMAYLSTVKDSSTNEILVYNLSNSLAIEPVTETIDKLVSTESFKLHKDAFIHSDQGVHYTSPRFQNLLKQNNLGQSMSRKGNCWDNAPQESFFGHMKDELGDLKNVESFEELKTIIDDYMDYYNKERYQYELAKLSPNEYAEYYKTGIYPLKEVIEEPIQFIEKFKRVRNNVDYFSSTEDISAKSSSS